MGRQSGQKLQCLYENPIANDFLQNWILHNFWNATLKYKVEGCIHEVMLKNVALLEVAQLILF